MRSMLSFTVIALGATALTPAFAQSSSAPVAASPAAPAAPCQAGVSKDARDALVALQTAVVAKNAPAIPALVAAAQAKAKSNDDKCFIAQMQLKAAVDSNDLPGVAAAIDAQRASGSVPASTLAILYEDLGRMQYKASSFAAASTSFERAMQIAPNLGSPVAMLAETRAKQERTAEALPLYQKAIALETAAGRKADENWHKRAVAVAFAARNPLAYGLARDWVAAYPNAKNWRDAILVYREVSRLEDPIDLFRLQRINRALAGDADFGRYARLAIDRGFPGEAKAVLEEGIASGAIRGSQATIKGLLAEASGKASGDRAGLAGQSKTALAGSAAKPVMALGEAYFGYGDYARAAEMFRAALGKSGVDAGRANLRLGMSLAAAGDKAGASAALNAVTGPGAETARYWLAYAATR